jgi:hypothetical protein
LLRETHRVGATSTASTQQSFPSLESSPKKVSHPLGEGRKPHRVGIVQYFCYVFFRLELVLSQCSLKTAPLSPKFRSELWCIYFFKTPKNVRPPWHGQVQQLTIFTVTVEKAQQLKIHHESIFLFAIEKQHKICKFDQFKVQSHDIEYYSKEIATSCDHHAIKITRVFLNSGPLLLDDDQSRFSIARGKEN